MYKKALLKGKTIKRLLALVTFIFIIQSATFFGKDPRDPKKPATRSKKTNIGAKKQKKMKEKSEATNKMTEKKEK